MCSCVRVKYREILIVGYEEDEYLLRVKTEHALHIQKERRSYKLDNYWYHPFLCFVDVDESWHDHNKHNNHGR